MGIELNRPSTALLFYSGLSLALFGLFVLLPFIGLFSIIWTPLPLILLYLRHGARVGRRGALGATLAVAIMFAVLGAPGTGLIFLHYAIIAVGIGEAACLAIKPGSALGIATVLGGIVLFLLVALLGYSTGNTLAEVWEIFWASQEQVVLAIFKDVSQDPEATAQLREAFKAVFYMMVSLSPAMCLLSSLMVAWFNLLIARVRMRRWSGIEKGGLGGLLVWRAPDVLVWPLIGCGALSALTSGTIFWAGLNGLMVLGAVYFLQGIAIIAFWLEKKNVPPLMRVCVFLLLPVQIYLVLLVALLGLFDMWFDFRRLKAETETV